MNPSIDAATRFRLADKVHARPIDGAWVLLDLRVGSYFGLDEVGGLVWERLRRGMTIEQIAEDLLAQFTVEKVELIRDIVAFTSDLVARGICVPEAPAGR